MRRLGVEEIDAGVIAENMDLAGVVGVQAASEGEEVREGFREGKFEEREEVGGGDRRVGEKNSLLDVLTGEHWEIGNGEAERFNGGFEVGVYSAF